MTDPCDYSVPGIILSVAQEHQEQAMGSISWRVRHLFRQWFNNIVDLEMVSCFLAGGQANRMFAAFPSTTMMDAYRIISIE